MRVGIETRRTGATPDLAGAVEPPTLRGCGGFRHQEAMTMAGFSDGVSTVWIVRAGKGLEVDGYETDFCAIEALIRRILARGGPEMKAGIMESVDAAMRHLDETDGPASEGE
jgi:hypothetical protein